MAVYANVSELEEILPYKFTDTSNPTETQVLSIITRHSSRIDLLLKTRGISSPSEGTIQHSFLKQAVLYLTAMDVLRRKAIETGQASSALADDYERLAGQLLDTIQNNPQALVT